MKNNNNHKNMMYIVMWLTKRELEEIKDDMTPYSRVGEIIEKVIKRSDFKE